MVEWYKTLRQGAESKEQIFICSSAWLCQIACCTTYDHWIGSEVQVKLQCAGLKEPESVRSGNALRRQCWSQAQIFELHRLHWTQAETCVLTLLILSFLVGAGDSAKTIDSSLVVFCLPVRADRVAVVTWRTYKIAAIPLIVRCRHTSLSTFLLLYSALAI